MKPLASWPQREHVPLEQPEAIGGDLRQGDLEDHGLGVLIAAPEVEHFDLVRAFDERLHDLVEAPGGRFKGLVLIFILSASMFPPIATVSPLFIIIRALHLRDTWWGLIMTYTTFTLPLSIWIMTNFFREIPDEIYLASRVDGCSPFQSFVKIMLPLAAPGIATAAILVFIFAWNEFLFALTFTATPASRTIPVAIALFPGLHEMPWGDIAAASIVVTIPLIVLVLLFQRRIIEGLTAGAVKG